MSETTRRLRLTRWCSHWRARLSIPSLLASYDERKAVSCVAAFNGATSISILTLLAWLADLPLLFPALGPSAFILFRVASHGAYVLSHGPVGGYSDKFLGGEGWSIRRLRFGLPVLMPFAPRYGMFGGTYYVMPLSIPLAAMAIPTGVMFRMDRRSRRKMSASTEEADAE